MRLKDYFAQNNVVLSPLGEDVFKRAVMHVLPIYKSCKDSNLLMAVLVWDLKDEECQGILNYMAKYSKLYIYS